MTPQHLTHDLSTVTRELLSAKEADLGRIGQLLDRRSSILADIAESDPHAFTPEDLTTLRSATLDGDAAKEKLNLLRRKAAADWHRLNRLRDSTAQSADAAISLQA